MVMTVEDDNLEEQVAAELRTWARGLLPIEAAIELLATSCSGRLLTGPWTRVDDRGRLWFDAERAVAEGDYLSGGERRVLAIATSLASDDHSINLSDTISGLDGDALDAVLAALAHAGGRNFLRS